MRYLHVEPSPKEGEVDPATEGGGAAADTGGGWGGRLRHGEGCGSHGDCEEDRGEGEGEGVRYRGGEYGGEAGGGHHQSQLEEGGEEKGALQ